MTDDDAFLVQNVRRGDASTWESLIARYQGRLLAFAEARLHDIASSEDVVQETFLGFLTALPNYDDSTPLESFLFSIAAHKLTDVLRKNGRRPVLPLFVSDDSTSGHSVVRAIPASRIPQASSLARSAERKTIEEKVLGECLKSLVTSWISRGEFERLQCAELLFVLGKSNKDVASQLQISEQTVANHKSFVLQKLKTAAEAARLRDINWTRVAGDTV